MQVDNHAQFNNYVDVKGGLGVVASANIAGSLSVGKQLIDSSGNAGTAGQVLSSTSTSTQWIDLACIIEVPQALLAWVN